MINKIQTLLVMLILFVINTPTYGTNYYVDKDATGNNNGTNWLDAWESFASINWSLIQPGDSIYVSGGTTSKTYTETFSFQKSGIVNNYIVFAAGKSVGHNGNVILDGSSERISFTQNYVEVNGFYFTGGGGSKGYIKYDAGGPSATSNHHLRVKNCNFLVSDRAGIYMQYHPHNIEILDNYFEQTVNTSDQGDLIFIRGDVDSGNPWADSISIKGNTFVNQTENPSAHSDGFQGLYCKNVWYENNKSYLFNNKTAYTQMYYNNWCSGKQFIANNLFYISSPASSPFIYVNGYDATLDTVIYYNNTFVTNYGRSPFTTILPSGTAGKLVMKNNIFVNTATTVAGAFEVSKMVSVVADYNIFYAPNSSAVIKLDGNNLTWSQWQSSGRDAHGYNQQPSFANFDWNFSKDKNTVLNYDFSLTSNSTGIDDGVDLGARWNTALDNISRPQGSAWDIGAYEMVTGGGGGNNPPNQPVNPNPQNGAINQSITLTLSWSCTDPNGDPLTYDVYFGNTNNPPLVSGNQTGTSYNPGQLNNNTTYYWEIVAKDNQGATTAGPVWNFTTVTGGGGDVTPPEVVSAALLDSVTLRIIFTEPLEQNSAQNINNYSITNNIDVLNSSLSDSEVTLTTTEHLPNVFYTVTVNNVTDLAGNIISPTANTAPYQYIAANELTELQIDSAYAEAWYQNYNPPKAIDGITEPVDPESRWGGALPMPDSIMFDLGQDKMVGQTRFSFYAWNGGRIYTYSVYSSMDGNSWSAVAENISSSSTEWSVLNFNLIECRYIKLVSLTNNQSQWAGLYEAEIWGLDQATAANTLVEEIPTDYKLEQNYPNPFNPTTTIRFSIPSSQHVKINVYNVIGELVKELVNNEYSSGTYSVEFNAADLPSGIYLYRLESQSFNYTRKMILVK